MYKHRLTLMSLNGLTASIIEQIRKYVKTCHLCVNSIYFEGICAFFLIELGRVKKKKKKTGIKRKLLSASFTLRIGHSLMPYQSVYLHVYGKSDTK